MMFKKFKTPQNRKVEELRLFASQRTAIEKKLKRLAL